MWTYQHETKAIGRHRETRCAMMEAHRRRAAAAVAVRGAYASATDGAAPVLCVQDHRVEAPVLRVGQDQEGARLVGAMTLMRRRSDEGGAEKIRGDRLRLVHRGLARGQERIVRGERDVISGNERATSDEYPVLGTRAMECATRESVVKL